MHEPHPQYGHPPVPPPRHRLNYSLLAAVGAGAVLVLLVGIASTGADQDDEPAGAAAAATPTGAPVPPYRIVDTARDRYSTDITVEVEQAPPGGGLKQIFTDVRRKHRDAGGYFVMINCSSGGTAGSDNRLAYGRYAYGNEGQAVTGLEDGGTEFETFPAECPAR